MREDSGWTLPRLVEDGRNHKRKGHSKFLRTARITKKKPFRVSSERLVESPDPPQELDWKCCPSPGFGMSRVHFGRNVNQTLTLTSPLREQLDTAAGTHPAAPRM